MAKKSRKPNLPQDTLERARREMAQQTGQVLEVPATRVAPGTAAPDSAPKRKIVPTSEASLRSEYAYVLSDLQNMGILAAVMMVVLVVLSVLI